MNLKRAVVRSALAGVCLLSAQSYAASGLYLGGSVGNAKVGYEPTENREVDIRDNDIGYKLFGGFKFTLAAVEVGYVDFGKIEGAEGDVEISGFNGFGVLSMGLGPAEVFGKVGGFVWESDYRAVQTHYDNSGFDPAFGIGASFGLGGIDVRAEYEYFDIGEFDEVSMLSVGARFWML